MGSAGEPPGPRVPLLVTRTLRLLPVLHRLRHLPHAATAAAQGVEVVAAQGAEMAVAEGEAEKTRRRDDLGEAVVATAI
jgi:hypothetical protein